MDGRRSVTASQAPSSADEISPRERIRLIVAAIPEGSVATYGDVARFAGLPRRARMVGQVLAALPAGSRLPWHRVLRADGRIATRDDGETTQALRLEAEGILVRAGQVDLRRHRWQP